MRRVSYIEPYWDECNPRQIRFYKKGELKRINRKRWLKKVFKGLELE